MEGRGVVARNLTCADALALPLGAYLLYLRAKKWGRGSNHEGMEENNRSLNLMNSYPRAVDNVARRMKRRRRVNEREKERCRRNIILLLGGR